MPNGRTGRRRSRGRRRRGRKAAARTATVNALMYTKNLTFTKFYDNEGVDEQGISTLITFDYLFPSGNTQYGNDYNRSCTIQSVKFTVRWGAGFSNPPIAVALQWVRGGSSQIDYTWNGPSTWLNASKPTTLSARAPLPVRSYVIENPGDETKLGLRLKFYGMDLVGTDVPAMSFVTTFVQEPIIPIARSGK